MAQENMWRLCNGKVIKKTYHFSIVLKVFKSTFLAVSTLQMVVIVGIKTFLSERKFFQGV